PWSTALSMAPGRSGSRSVRKANDTVNPVTVFCIFAANSAISSEVFEVRLPCPRRINTGFAFMGAPFLDGGAEQVNLAKRLRPCEEDGFVGKGIAPCPGHGLEW